MLRQLSTMKFLLMSERHSFATDDNPDVIRSLGSFCEAQLYKHHDYCCMSSPIFDSVVSFKSPRSEEFTPRFEQVMDLLGISLNPQIDVVKLHLNRLIDCCNTYNQQEIQQHLKSLFFETYKFLQSCQAPLPDFENARCILIESKLFKPKNIVFNWTHDLSPYLFKCPHELDPFRDFLLILKVADYPNYKHFIFVLNCIRGVNGSSKLNEDNPLCLQAQRAFSYLISELHSFSELQPEDLGDMLLLTDNNELIPLSSPSLFHADDTQLLNRFFAVADRLKILAPLAPNELGSFSPPQCLGIKLLSDRFKQRVSPCVYGNFRNEDIIAENLRKQLVSGDLYLALKRIYFHDTHKDMGKVRIRNKEVVLQTEGGQYGIEDGYLSIRDKIGRLNIVSVSRIDIVITDTSTGVPSTLEDACICFLDEDRDTILLNVHEVYRQRLPVEMTYELNQYFVNLFDRSLIHLLICHVYTGEDIGRALSNFKIRKLPPGLAHD